MDNDTRKMTSYAMLLALSLILGYLESMLPTPFPIPGIKLVRALREPDDLELFHGGIFSKFFCDDSCETMLQVILHFRKPFRRYFP